VRNMSAIALGLLVTAFGLYGAPAVTPLAIPAAFDTIGGTTNALALIVMLMTTQVFTAFGGWVTARIVTDHRVGHAIFMAMLGLVAAVLVGAIRWGAAPLWYYAVSWTLMPFAAALGAAAWERTLRRSSSAAERRIATS